MKILIFPRFGRQGASSRMRFSQYLPFFSELGIDYVTAPLFDDALLLKKYRQGGYGLLNLLLAYWRRIRALTWRRRFDLVWIEKEALPWFPAWLERWLLRGVPYVLDFDDAIFHNYDAHKFYWARHVYGQRIDRLMAGARLIVAGNRYLADRATAAGARSVEVIPTVVDLARYFQKRGYSSAAKPRIVWIGSPSTVQYLLDLAESFCTLAKRRPFTLRVIGGGAFTMPGVDVESLPWSEDTETALLEECDIGIMPLKNTPWERGKCAYKLIQYMASGLPTVASAVGANCEVVIDGKTGFLVSTEDQWVEQLVRLLDDSRLRLEMGRAGHLRASEHYSLQVIAPRLANLLKKAGEA